ncbi:MAG: LysM peptidoglycan-binding domain-containing protein [Phycisphaerales bacterium]|nr:MAG: LysM peptidoglycan-binding domain-containing protein [Phycisphaerales bacterium]
MGRETKVGLLAGLAFIICFAIILANRGRQEPPMVPLPYVVDGSVDIEPAAQTPDARDTTRQPPAAQGPDGRSGRPRADSLADRSDPVRVDRGGADGRPGRSASSGAEVVLPSDATTLAESSPRSRGGEGRPSRPRGGAFREEKTSPDESALAAVSEATGGPTLAAPSRAQAGQQRILQEYLDARSPRRPADEGSKRSAVERPTDGKATRRTRPQPLTPAGESAATPAPDGARPVHHTVVAGDSLSKIAAAHYGSRSPTVINAVFDANRNVLSSPDLLSVGMELKLPVITGFDLRSRAGRDSSVSRAAARRDRVKTTQPDGAAFRWYQIRENDRYISIAREQLGDGRRWQEIHELNRDKFPDPDRIRPGVRIKLPVTVQTPTGEAGR